MDKDEALRFALEALEAITKSNQSDHQAEIADEAITAIKAALEANEFNPDWDTQAVLVEEIQRMAKRIEELEAKDEPYALEASMYSNDRVKVDPVTGNVSIGIPQRTWVGLTADEMLEALRSVDAATAVNLLMSQYKMPPTFKVYAEAIEAKLKEKNT
jgi:hypothetical protein